MKIAIGIILGFALGFVVHSLLPRKASADKHWKAIQDYNVFITNAANYEPDASTGLSVTTPPDILPDLAALVSAGELTHVDLIFPGVKKTREAGRYLMKFAQRHPEIIYISGNPSYSAFKPNGEEPLHLNVWFKDADESVVQTLVHELEAIPQNGSQPDGAANRSQPVRSETNQTSAAAGPGR